MLSTKKWGFLLICILLLNFPPIYSFPVITEVMSNVKGNDTGAGSPGDRNEFIELYNKSDSNVIVTHYLIGDGDAIDNICLWHDSLGIPADNVVLADSILHPHQFAVIMDPEYCSAEYENLAYFMPYSFGDSCLILTVGNTTIGNGLSTSDAIFLYDSNLVIVGTYGTPFDTSDNIPRDPGDGISMEKVYLYGNDTDNNWLPSKSLSGCSPGNYNSVSVNNLVKISCFYQVTQDTFNFHFTFKNEYHIDLDNVNINLQLLEFTENRDFLTKDSSLLFSGNIIDSIFTVSCKHILNPSNVYIAKIEIKNSKVTSTHNFWIKGNENSIPPIEINEIMENGNISPDWIELHNISHDTISLIDAHIDVDDNRYTLPDFAIPPDKYIIVLHDSTAFYTKYSRNIDLIISHSNFSITQGDSLKLYVDNTNIENMYINRESHFGKDTSMERIKENIPASEQDNWTFSRDITGATPGAKNSVIDTSIGNATQSLIISPNPFNYRRDNAISIRFPSDTYLINSIHIYKPDGYRLADISINNPYIKEILWKPKTSTGETLSTGLYIIVVKYENKQGKRHLIKIPLAIKSR